jgi:hypothetical protein
MVFEPISASGMLAILLGWSVRKTNVAARPRSPSFSTRASVIFFTGYDRRIKPLRGSHCRWSILSKDLAVDSKPAVQVTKWECENQPEGLFVVVVSRPLFIGVEIAPNDSNLVIG